MGEYLAETKRNKTKSSESSLLRKQSQTEPLYDTDEETTMCKQIFCCFFTDKPHKEDVRIERTPSTTDRIVTAASAPLQASPPISREPKSPLAINGTTFRDLRP